LFAPLARTVFSAMKVDGSLGVEANQLLVERDLIASVTSI
jgi:hypothetical protein